VKLKKRKFGILETGEAVSLYTLSAGDLNLSVSAYGATLVSLTLPSKAGRRDDILLGFSTLSRYASKHPYFGAAVGRYANRIGGGSFSLDGVEYRLDKNNGPNSLHGGFHGFDKLVWDAEPFEDKGAVGVVFTHSSPSGDEGYPGNLKASICYALSKDASLAVTYKATLDARCPVNLTNHAYFNLKGEGRGNVLDHVVELSSSSFVPVGPSLIPTGEIRSVEGSAFDFRDAKPIGKDIAMAGGGYDHCFVVDGKPGKLRSCAKVFEPTTGRTMKVSTTQPGVQFYTGNFLDGIAGKRGSVYDKHSGFCLETQHFPDSPNQPSFPDCIFGPGRDYEEQALFSFDW